MENIKVHGLKELEKALSKLELKTSGAALRKSLRSAAIPMMDKIKARTPVRTGALKRSIRLSSSVRRSNRNKYSARARILIGGKGTKTRATVTHALQQEFGTSKMKANPFIRRTADDDKNAFISRFKKHLKENIQKAVS